MMAEIDQKKEPENPGNLLFAALFFLFSLFLISQLGSQTKWLANTKLFAQPGFWPALSVIGMAGFCFLHGIEVVRRNWHRRSLEKHEAWVWLRSLEFAAWYMGYVFIVPAAGYLLATILVAPLLAFRMGYRNKRTLCIAAAFGFAVVLIFKTFLQVRIPGGMVYEFLPAAARNIFIQYF